MRRTVVTGIVVLVAALSVTGILWAETVEELKIRAKQGDAAAQLNLGMMYSRGLGVSVDKTLALAWLRIAAAQGNDEAKVELDRISAKDGLSIAKTPSVNTINNIPTGGSIPTGPGTLDIQATPPDVSFSVFSGYTFVFSGLAPFNIKNLRTGEYNVCFERQGHDLFWKTIRIDERTPSITVNLRQIDPQKATLSCIEASKKAQAREILDAQEASEEAQREAARKKEDKENLSCFSFQSGPFSYWTCKDKRTGKVVSQTQQ